LKTEFTPTTVKEIMSISILNVGPTSKLYHKHEEGI